MSIYVVYYREILNSGQEPREILDCPRWVQILDVDDALLGTLCLILSDEAKTVNMYR